MPFQATCILGTVGIPHHYQDLEPTWLLVRAMYLYLGTANPTHAVLSVAGRAQESCLPQVSEVGIVVATRAKWGAIYRQAGFLPARFPIFYAINS